MKKKQFEPLVIHHFEEKVFHLPVHGHTYYELVYIWKGNGVHLLNNSRMNYQAGDLFLISPDDEHCFEIGKSTRFTFIKFTDNYFSDKGHLYQDRFLSTSPETIMRNKQLKEMKLKINQPCRSILHNTVENITKYEGMDDIASSPILYYQILSIFGLIEEAITAKFNIVVDHHIHPNKEFMISYIHQHIYEPERLLTKNIAAHFNIGGNYFSAFFKRKFEVSYRNYVNQYRLKLIEGRIASGELTMKQIANEFGFTDDSHLSHFFKSMHNISPASYRNLHSRR